MFPWILEEINHSNNDSDPDLRVRTRSLGHIFMGSILKNMNMFKKERRAIVCTCFLGLC